MELIYRLLWLYFKNEILVFALVYNLDNCPNSCV